MHDGAPGTIVYIFPAWAHSVHVGPKIVLVPLQSSFKYNYYVCLHLEDLYTLYWKNTLLNNHFGPRT